MKNFYYTIASSSKGNCSLYSNKGVNILIDIGVSLKTLKLALENIKLSINDLTALVITHEHSDHIKGLETFIKNISIPVYITRESLLKDFGNELNIFKPGDVLDISGISVKTFNVPHDSKECVGFVFDDGNYKLGYATDFGCVTLNMRKNLKGCDIVVLEANHDINMLNNCMYPISIKNRIMSNVGHLSNGDCANFVCELVDSGTHKIILAHLSENSNTPELAYEYVSSILKMNNLACDLSVAPIKFNQGKILCCI